MTTELECTVHVASVTVQPQSSHSMRLCCLGGGGTLTIQQLKYFLWSKWIVVPNVVTLL